MPLFSLDKWYFDVLDEDNHYLFLYFARARLAGRSQTHFHLSAARLGDLGIAAVHVPLTEAETV